MTGEREKTGTEKSEDLLAELQSRVRQQAVVADLGVYALAGADLQALMDQAVAEVSKTLEMDYTKVLELLPSGDRLMLKAGVGWQEGLVGKATVGTDRESQAGYTLRSKEPVIVEDLRTETRFSGPSLLIEHGVVSGMSVIIYGAEGAYGVLGTHTRQLRPFTRDDIHFIQAVANIIGTAVERKRFEEKLRASQRELEQRVDARTEELRRAYEDLEAFSYRVSHDLRAPLRAISGFNRAILEDYGTEFSEGARRFLERVQAAAGRMGEMIDSMLELSRYSIATVSPAPVDLTRLSREIVDGFFDREPERRISVEIADDLHAFGDPSLLRSVLENLLENAWKFTREANDPKIEVGQLEGSGNSSTFFVRDNGIGFDMSRSPQLFTPFERLTTDTRYEGTGIGLSTARKIIERHDGSLWAESELGKGATFYFTLPTERT